MTSGLDEIDRRVIDALRRNPRASITALAASVGVARGTLYARLEALEDNGVITGYGPEIDPTAAGFGVLAFCTLEISQGSHAETVRALSKVVEVLEIHTITGDGDLLLRVIATSNDHLHQTIQTITAVPTVQRSQTQLALSSIRHSSAAAVVAAL